MLQIALHDGQNLALGFLPSSEHSASQAALMHASQHTQMWVCTPHLLHHLPCAVWAIIIHHNNLE
jgi:hypothetical protein